MRFPLLDMFGFRITLTMLSGVSGRDVDLSDVISVGTSRVPPGACDPLQGGFPSRSFAVALERLVRCDVSRDSGGTYSVLVRCTKNVGRVGSCVRQLDVSSFGLSRARSNVRSDFRTMCHG